MRKTLPRLIALCGNPDSGKSTAANLLSSRYGYKIADDALPLRRIAVDYLGLKSHQVFTQDGKLETVDLNGRDWKAREVLGELGNAFEEKFGANIIPIMTQMTFDPENFYVMGSVRRDQGLFWRDAGALVVEIASASAPPSPFGFDCFNRDAITATVQNDARELGLSEKEGHDRLFESLARAIWAS